MKTKRSIEELNWALGVYSDIIRQGIKSVTADKYKKCISILEDFEEYEKCLDIHKLKKEQESNKKRKE
jgi:hypothetical protein